jgi:hypothetical protein
MWIKTGTATFWNLDQVVEISAALSGFTYEVTALFPHSGSSVILRDDFATQEDADAWIESIIRNVKED